MALGIRGSNPIWSEVDLTGQLFDDTFYLWVLENEIPYIPATVYHDPDLNVPWTNPIQFLGNGTLPVDIFFESDAFYRLEFRQNDGVLPPSQSDPLIYLVENYSPGSGGNTPIDTVGFSSSNQITNPQFSLIDFVSPYTFSGTDPEPIQISPDWFLELAGTGTVTLTQVPLNNSNPNPSNAPYALEITLNGWSADSVFLRQRFFQNGMLWANKVVSTAITARVQGLSVAMSVSLVDSNSSLLAQLLSTSVDDSFNEYTGYGELGDSTNTDLPPSAYIDYKIAIPSNVDIYLSSIQVIVQDVPFEPSFTQDSINRQLDQTFHVYKESILFQPKDELAVGWDFPLNPWQMRTTAATTIASSQYITDQTILSMQNPGSLSVSRATDGELSITTVPATTQQNFALIQYLDPLSILPYWESILSALATLSIQTSNGTLLNVKMKLISSTTLPSIVDPISSWVSNEPVFTGQWTPINAINNPTHVISSATPLSCSYNGFQLPSFSASTQTLGIVLYTTSALTSLDTLLINRISLIPNQFALDSTPKTFDQVIQECQFYYEKSYNNATVPGNGAGGGIVSQQVTSPITGSTVVGSISVIPRAFGYVFNTVKRTETPLVKIYSPNSGSIDRVYTVLFNGGVNIFAQDANISNWTQTYNSSKNCSFIPNNVAPLFTSGSVTGNHAEAYIVFHHTTDARLGLVV